MRDDLRKKDDIVFSLDIGTRTIIGIVGKYKDEGLEILASETLNHEKRAMYDGQIHDINSVVKVAGKVKESLENQIGFTLDRVAIAAAGRSLEVSKAKVTIGVDNTREIDKCTIKSAELEVVQEAERLLKEKKNEESTENKKYYCVGHTVINYFLDDILIENLEGHRGESITIEAIATFLPHTVVDSLNTVMNRLNLEVINMTLEPIAAINTAVKKNLRLLNIALIDIGAGTSDIAITKDGTITCYAMVPTAGDEITETLVKKYLMDYDLAEELKINLSDKNEHEFQDIIGTKYKLSTEDILDKIDDSIKKLAKEVTNRILDLNDGPPSVAFLIGGGSQIPRVAKYISESLGIPEERVAIKDTSLIENVIGIDEKISGPDAITPVGIAMMALENNFKDFLEISLNGERLKLFNNKNPKITDALLLKGFNPRNLLSKRGQGLKFYLNDIEKTILGQVGEPAKIYLNDKLTSLDSRIKDNDEIIIESATAGEDASVNLTDLVDFSKSVYVNGIEHKLILRASVNGREVYEDHMINQNDKVEILGIDKLEDLCEQLGIDVSETIILKDGKELPHDYLLKSEDDLIIDNKIKNNNIQEKVSSDTKTIELNINGEKKYIDYNKDEFKFVDVFDYIDFELKKAKGNLVLEINGKNAEYLQNLRNGDVLKIYWED